MEKTVENYLVEQVKKLGGICWKMWPISVAGLPDRIVLLPGGKVRFIELKSKGKKARPIQQVIGRKLIALGFIYLVIDSADQVKQFIANEKGK